MNNSSNRTKVKQQQWTNDEVFLIKSYLFVESTGQTQHVVESLFQLDKFKDTLISDLCLNPERIGFLVLNGSRLSVWTDGEERQPDLDLEPEVQDYKPMRWKWWRRITVWRWSWRVWTEETGRWDWNVRGRRLVLRLLSTSHQCLDLECSN